MQFTYTARTATGKEVTSTIEANSKLEAADKIFNEKNLTVITLEKIDTEKIPVTKETHKTKLDLSKAGSKIHIGKTETYQATEATATQEKLKNATAKDLINRINEWLIDHSKVSAKEKAIFFRQLAVMINAGLPIVKSLNIFVEQAENLRLKKILKGVAHEVENGSSFSGLLAYHRDIFTEAEIGVIASGEASGQLNRTLTELADETEKTASLKSKIKSAMIYPIVILVILVGVTIVVMTLVIPKLVELFLGSGVELPTSTKILIAGSNWFMDTTLMLPNWLLFPLFIVGIIFAIGTWKKTEQGKYLWDSFMLKLPIFGILHMKVALATFTRQLATLSSAGISIIRTLEIAANASANEAYRRRILAAKSEVEHGIPIHEAIANDKLFPSFTVSMIAVGEQTAQLSTVSDKVAKFYDEEVDTFVGGLSKIMEPVIIVIVGLLVGLLVAAIMQPIMQIADVASQAG